MSISEYVTGHLEQTSIRVEILTKLKRHSRENLRKGGLIMLFSLMINVSIVGMSFRRPSVY